MRKSKKRNDPIRSKDVVAIIGPGRVGQAMGRLLARAGIPIRFVAARDIARAKRAARFIGAGKAITIRDAALGEAKIFLLTVSDSALAPIAEQLAQLDFSSARRQPASFDLPRGQEHHESFAGKIALHTCGSLPLSVLDPLKERGASVGSMHPYQTIPNPAAGARSLLGAFWCVEGDAKARRLAVRWVKLLEGTSFSIPSGARTLYHLSAFLVCPTLVTLMEQSEQLLRKAGVPKRILRPMLAQFVSETVENVRAHGPRASLTGPASRGDWNTLERHRAALRRVAPHALPLYDQLVKAMLRLAGKKNLTVGRR